MKPSQRIEEIALNGRLFSDIDVQDHDYIRAIIKYLDEQYEQTKKEATHD